MKFPAISLTIGNTTRTTPAVDIPNQEELKELAVKSKNKLKDFARGLALKTADKLNQEVT